MNAKIMLKIMLKFGRAHANCLPADMSARSKSKSQARKKRTTNYKKRQQQYKGAKERLRFKCKELTQAVLDGKSDLEKTKEKLSKENSLLKR